MKSDTSNRKATTAPAAAVKPGKRSAGSQRRIVSLRGYAVPDHAKRKLVEIWLDHDENEARQILESFKLGFNTGATAQANDRTKPRREQLATINHAYDNDA